MSSLIQFEDMSFKYPLPDGEARPVLHDLSLKIEEGEYVAIIGANGSGKTTLARHLNALLVPTQGRVLVAGMDTRRPEHHAAVRAAVGMVWQFPEDQIVATVVEEDVAFGPENLGLPPAEIRRRVDAALQAVDMWEHRARASYLLSAGQMQRVALAGVLAVKPRCIVFDEATAMLDPLGRRTALDLMAQLHREGLTIISITHFMSDAIHAGRVIVLSEGRIAMDGSPEEIFSQPGALAALGLDLPPAARVAEALREKVEGLPGGLFTVDALVQAMPDFNGVNQKTPQHQDQSQPNSPITTPWIQVQDLDHVYLAGTPLAQPALEKASFSVQEGAVHGVLGATGSGKSTLLQHLNGILRPQTGRVQVGPYDLNDPKLDVRLVRRMVGLVFQIPEANFFEQYVGDEIAFGPRLLGGKEGLRETVRWAMEMVGLDFERYVDRLTFTLSGGERRKVALASILAVRPQVLVLDEPMAGLDPVSRRDLLENLKSLHRNGMTLIFSSHYMEDVGEIADHLTVFHDGRDVLHGSTGEVFSREERLREIGLVTPVATQIAEGLRRRGWPVPPGITSPAALVSAVEQLSKARAI